MGGLRKLKRAVKKSIEEDGEVALTEKGIFLLERLRMIYLNHLCSGRWSEAEQMIKDMVEHADLVGWYAMDSTHKAVAEIVGVNYRDLSREEQHRFLIDNPSYLDRFVEYVKDHPDQTRDLAENLEQKLFAPELEGIFQEHLETVYSKKPHVPR